MISAKKINPGAKKQSNMSFFPGHNGRWGYNGRLGGKTKEF
jgi:hypothetical protein